MFSDLHSVMNFESLPVSREWRRRIILVLSSILFSFLLLEILLRLTMPGLRVFTQPDTLLGYSFIPGARYDFVPPENCPTWGTSDRVNNHGLIDENLRYNAPDETFRVLALGDSYTEGLQFERESRYTDVLEAQLAATLDVPAQVINAGRSGMGTTLQYLYFTERGERYDADVVTLVFVQNDFQDNSRALVYDQRPYHLLTDDGELVLDNSFREDPAYQYLLRTEFLRQNFYFVSFLRQQYALIRAGAAQRDTAPTDETIDEAPTNDPTALATTSADPDLQPYIDAIAVTERVLVELARAVAADGSEFVFAIGTVPTTETYIDAYTQHRDAAAVPVDEALYAFATGQGIRTLNMAPLLAQAVAETGERNHSCAEYNWAGHWNRTGHGRVAEYLYDFMRAEGLLPD